MVDFSSHPCAFGIPTLEAFTSRTGGLMKMNFEIDLTPEELRRFMGLPDVQGWQQQMLETFTDNLKNSQGQQEEFMRSIFGNTFAPWQSYFTSFNSMNGVKPDPDKP
jgi:hypothetical protein